MGDLGDGARARPEHRGIAEPLSQSPTEGGGVEVSRRGHEPHLECSRAATLAHDQIAQKAAARATVEGAQFLLRAPIAYEISHLVVALRREQAIARIPDLLPAATRVKAEHERTRGGLAERILHLVAVPPDVCRLDDRLEAVIAQPAEPGEGGGDLRLLVLELALVAKSLPQGARTPSSLVIAALGHPVGTLLEHLDRACLGVVSLRLEDLGANEVAWKASLHEDDVAVAPRDPRSAVGEVLDLEREHFSRPWSLRKGASGGVTRLVLEIRHPRILACPMGFDIDSYGAEAERFVSALDREYYLHFAGHKESFEIVPIYERHAHLFGRGAVEQLREAFTRATVGDDRRRCRYLLQLAVEGFIGEATKKQATALAEREGALELELNGDRASYREAAILQANEPDAARRLAIEEARHEALESELNPLHLEIVERAHRAAVELGWPSYRAMYEELKALDLASLERQTRAFSDATAGRYRELVEPQIVAETGLRFEELRRADLPYFFRARRYDGLFPTGRLTEALEHTLTGLGIDLRGQANVKLDVEQRPRKSARAFCAPVHVPSEIYLVIPRKGGRDDYSALFHEGGHTEHYASVDPELPFEFRHLGDNSVTEGFAFLFEHLTEDPLWLERVLGGSAGEGYGDYVRASKLIFLRRYAAKLRYELELHAGTRPLVQMPELYARCLADAVGVEWSAVTYLADVDEGYYAANYLRAWVFEAQLRRILLERFGQEWFASRETGDFLRAAWRGGQRLDADELLEELGGGRLDFSVMVDEVGA
jgi:hypothetical protein